MKIRATLTGQENYLMDCFYTMTEFYERMVCQFSLGTTFNESCSCFIYFISLSRGLENQEDFVVTARNKTKFDGPEINIQ